MVNHDYNTRTPPCPLQVVAKFDVLGVMPVILPSTVLMEGFFILTMLLYNWLEQRTKFGTVRSELAFFLLTHE
jgi:hypothetical protein